MKGRGGREEGREGGRKKGREAAQGADLAKAEVDHLDVPRGVDHQILGLCKEPLESR
jgi:hypothetical protein